MINLLKIGNLCLLDQAELHWIFCNANVTANSQPSSNFMRKKIDRLVNASGFTPYFLKSMP